MHHHKAILPGCDLACHQRAIEEFTTGETIKLSKWWCGLPRLVASHDKSINHYIEACHEDEGCHMVSWRAQGAPIFTLLYRGHEVDALKIAGQDDEDEDYPERRETSRTVLFSHQTRECFVAKKGLHLRHGDPAVMVQCITDTYLQREGQGYQELSKEEIASRFSAEAKTITGINSNGDPVCGSDTVSVLALKIIDMANEISSPSTSIGGALSSQSTSIGGASSSNTSPIDRVTAMHAIGVCLQRRPEMTHKLSVMWCGKVSVQATMDMLNLRHTCLRHTMSHVVIMTEDPYVQIHLQVFNFFPYADFEPKVTSNQGILDLDRASLVTHVAQAAVVEDQLKLIPEKGRKKQRYFY